MRLPSLFSVLFLILCLTGGSLSAAMWQDRPSGKSAPGELTRVPLYFQERSGTARKCAFSLSLPLPQGALFDTRQLRLCAADGSEIPLQSALMETWPDGSCRFLFLRGVISLAPGEKKECHVEYGSRVLRAVFPGIVTAAAKERLLLDTGAVSAEWDAAKFQLPEKISAGESRCGTFLPPPSPDAAEMRIEESGPCSTLLTLRNQKNNALLRMRFFRELPLAALEYIPGGNERFSLHYQPFSPSKQPLRLTLPEPGKVLWIDLIEAKALPLEAEYPVEGTLPPEYLSSLGLFPETCSPANASMRQFADQWVTRIRMKRASMPLKMAAALWFRTGAREDLLPLLEMLAQDHSPEAAVIRRKVWLMTGLNACWQENFPLSATPQKSAPAGTAAAVAEKAEKAGPTERNRLIALLSHGFDPASGSWKEFLDERGAASGGEASQSVNLRCALLLMQSANEIGDPSEAHRLAEISFAAIRRIFFDRMEREDFSVMGAWFHQAEIRLKNHPDENFDFNDRAYWDERCRAVPPSFALKVSGPRTLNVTLLRSPGTFMLTRQPVSPAEAPHRCAVTSEDGKTVFERITDRENIAQKILLTGKQGEHFTVTLTDDGSGVWDLPAGADTLTALPAGGNGVILHRAQWKRFWMIVPPHSPALRFRFQPLSPETGFRMLLIDPHGEEIENADFSALPLRPADAPRQEVSSPAPGVWEIRLHVSQGDAFFAADGKNPPPLLLVRP